MYLPSHSAIVLEIPKNGSSTLRRLVEENTGEVVYPGHHTEYQTLRRGEQLGWTIDVTYALIREPWERFVSGVNYKFARTEYTLAESVRRVFEHKKMPHRRVFDLQTRYLDGDNPKRLFRFYRMGDLLSALGFSGDVHENKGPTRWTLPDFEPWEREIGEMLAADIALYESLLDD